MGKCYNVVLDSIYPYVAGVAHSSDQYYVNWDAIMPDKAYKVRFSCMTANETITDSAVMCLNIDLGCNDTYVYRNNGMTTSNILGFLDFRNGAGTLFYKADMLMNAPIFISGRPTVNQITVQFTNGSNANSIYSTPAIANYVLTLNFEEV